MDKQVYLALPVLAVHQAVLQQELLILVEAEVPQVIQAQLHSQQI